MRGDDFLWWRERVRTELSRFDIVRVDHFRGFESAWEIPAHETTGERGAWQPSPGNALFEALQREFGTLPLVAEDLGLITEPVRELRRQFSIPGMKVLQFAFDSDAKNPYLPHNYTVDSVVYTGTHDNDTTLGWFTSLAAERKHRVREYLRLRNGDIADALISAALQSVSLLAMVPMQDLLKLDSSHRMNTPATTQGNWRWQFDWSQVPDTLASELRSLLTLYGRLSEDVQP
jgi:4-alpha-glucanotransferase